MARIGLYVSEADKAWLDALPPGLTGAALLREAIARARRAGDECAHENLEIVCRDCRAPLDPAAVLGDTHPVDTSEPDEAAGDEETPGQPGADPVCI